MKDSRSFWFVLVGFAIVSLCSCGEKTANLTVTNKFPNDISEITYNGEHYAPTLANWESHEFTIEENKTGLHKIYFRDVGGSGSWMETTDLVYTEPGGSTRYDITPGSSVVSF